MAIVDSILEKSESKCKQANKCNVIQIINNRPLEIKFQSCKNLENIPPAGGLTGDSIIPVRIEHNLEQGDRIRWNKSFHHFRYVICLIAGFSLGCMIFMRLIFTVAILNMVDQTGLYLLEHPNSTMEEYLDQGFPSGGEFLWNNEIQQMIISWYMFAYTIPQVAGTKLALKMGDRYSIPCFLSVCVLSNLLTPMVAQSGWQWVIVLRLLNGLGATAILPIMLTIVERWMPTSEVSLGLTLAQMVQACVNTTQPLISGYLCSIHWSLAFYVSSGVVLLYCFLWLIIMTDSPQESRFLSDRELRVICEGQTRNCKPTIKTSTTSRPDRSIKVICDKNQALSAVEASDESQQIEPTQQLDTNRTKSATIDPISKKDDSHITEKPAKLATQTIRQPGFRDLLRLPIIYLYIIMWCLYVGSSSVFQFVMPTYMRQFLKLDIADNGFYCSLIQIGNIISCSWPLFALSFLQAKPFNLSLTASRRILQLLLSSVVALTWLYVACEHKYQLIMFFLNRCFHSSNDVVATGTIMTNFSEAGLTGLAFSLINSVGNLFVVFASSLTGFVLDETNQSVEGWSWIFTVCAGSQLIMMLLFCFFTKSEPIEFKNLQIQQIESTTNHQMNHNDEAKLRTVSQKRA